ncbi:MAG: hypothetical protein C4589_01855 [Peptococcaceae bacterium]|nr:MAG: hypothetical protein C4589_01855 [Peptococcaceae bacterium]
MNKVFLLGSGDFYLKIGACGEVVRKIGLCRRSCLGHGNEGRDGLFRGGKWYECLCCCGKREIFYREIVIAITITNKIFKNYY